MISRNILLALISVAFVAASCTDGQLQNISIFPKDSGRLENGIRQGLWKSYHINRRVKETGWYIDGLKDSTWNYYSANGQLREITRYQMGKKEGASIVFDDEGRKYTETNFKNDILHGAFIHFHQGLENFRTTYSQGIPVGPDTVWHRNGKIKQVQVYVDGKDSAIWKEYNENGVLIYEGPLR
jgi:antitoxin component YwqK of YwqJK toxin-antitoxin module